MNFILLYTLPEAMFTPAGNVVGYFWNTYLQLKTSKASDGGKGNGKGTRVKQEEETATTPSIKSAPTTGGDGSELLGTMDNALTNDEGTNRGQRTRSISEGDTSGVKKKLN